MRHLRFGVHLVLLIGLAACMRGADIAGVSDSTYVATMAELHALEIDSLLDSGRRAEARKATLQERGLTPDQLERASRALANDPDRALSLLNAINQKLLATRKDSLSRDAPPP